MASSVARPPHTFVQPQKKAHYDVESGDDARKVVDYAEALMQCFGPRPHGMPEDPMRAKRPYEAYFLPDAYKGRSDYLLTTIIDAVISGNSFITGRCLPLLQHDNPEITWSTMSFDNAFVDYEPEQGVPRLLTQRSATFQDHMARRGIAFVVNHGFANTEHGRLDFFYKLAHMKHVLQETLDQDGLIQIVNCKNEYAGISNGLLDAHNRHDTDGRRACEKQLSVFACIQKRDRGWVYLDEDIKGQMARNGVQPDTWITPPGMKAFCALESANVEYFRAGPVAKDNVERGAKQNDVFRGTSVFTCNDYHLDNAEESVNPFCRDRVIGDYFILRDWTTNRMKADGANSKKLATQVYCCDTDRWETFDQKTTGEKFSEENFEGEAERNMSGKFAIDLAKELCKDIEKQKKKNASGEFYDPSNIKSKSNALDFIKACFRHDGSKNHGEEYSLLCVRPFRRYRMGSAVLMASGLDTGFTAHAHEDVQVGDDPISHVHVTHFTGWFSSTIVDTKRIAVAHDVFCMGYSGGEGKELAKRDDFVKQHPYQYMFGGQTNPGSVFVMLAPKMYGAPGGEKQTIVAPNPIDLSGSDLSGILHSSAQHGLPYPNFNNKLWEWKTHFQGRPMGSESVLNESKFAGEAVINSLCFQTMQKVISQEGDKSYEFGAYIRNTDHFGANHIGPGSRQSRCGDCCPLKEFNYEHLKEI